MKMKRVLAASVSVLVLGWSATLWAAEGSWKPKATAVIEVRQPDGNLRTYQSPSGAVYWSQDLPIVQGDKLTIHAFVSTGEAALKKAIIRLDNKEIKTLTGAPWRLEINSADLATGYHFVEVVATAGKSTDIGTATFMVAPASDPVLQQAVSPKAPEAAPVAPVTPELVCRVRSIADAADQAIQRGEVLILKEPALFRIQAATGASEYQYAITRDGKETYRSQSAPILNLIRLAPKQAGGAGLEPGDITLAVRAGDGKGNFGPPATVKIKVVSGAG